MNALLFATNTATQALTDGQAVNFGQPVRRYGKNIQLSGGNVVVNGEGYYPMIAALSFEAGAAATYTVQLYENGVAIPGARELIEAASGVIVSATVPGVVRIKCCEEKVITATISGGAATVENADIIVTKA